jgi:hypothetical protein
MPETQELEVLSIIDRFSLSHHSVARMFALGMTESMIRQRTGYSFKRLSLLIGSPSFRELIAHYAAHLDEKWNEAVDVYTDLGISNMIRAEAQIAEHLDKCEESGELMQPTILDKISQGRADRFGYSKHSVHHHEHDFASALDRAIARSGKGEELKTIEGKAEAVSPMPMATAALSPPQGTRPAKAPPRSSAGSRSFASVLEPVKRRKVA